MASLSDDIVETGLSVFRSCSRLLTWFLEPNHGFVQKDNEALEERDDLATPRLL